MSSYLDHYVPRVIGTSTRHERGQNGVRRKHFTLTGPGELRRRGGEGGREGGREREMEREKESEGGREKGDAGKI